MDLNSGFPVTIFFHADHACEQAAISLSTGVIVSAAEFRFIVVGWLRILMCVLRGDAVLSIDLAVRLTQMQNHT